MMQHHNAVRQGPGKRERQAKPHFCRPAKLLEPDSGSNPVSSGPITAGTPHRALNTAQGARDFIYSLHSTERSCLLRELHRFESIAIAQGEPPHTPGPAGREVFFHNALPFVGFGFLDNAIMIAAGTQIELSIGVVLGISTMAVWHIPIQNHLFLFCCSSSLAGYVEALASRLGLSIPDLTPKQADMWQTRLSAHLGKAIGVTIGCILGMFPLLFFGEEEEKLEEK
uniref:Transmembrane protein 65 n=1 Tax=Zosterops lateralis melanops TaxID=1220523 RepID=A0A8D2PXG3_ZOSLA